MTKSTWLSLSSTLLPALVLSACTTDPRPDPVADDPTGDLTAELATAPHTRFKTIFTTDARFVGSSLGGLAGADALCAQAASAARLTGTFKAWLSDKDTPATLRNQHASVPYKLVNGPQVAVDFVQLVEGSLDHPLDTNERGFVITDFASDASDQGVGTAWTATTVLGDVIPWNPRNPNPTENPRLDCGGWSTELVGVGTTGNIDSIDTDWTDHHVGFGCENRAHLYCLEQ